jgi:hypothetical protein
MVATTLPELQPRFGRPVFIAEYAYPAPPDLVLLDWEPFALFSMGGGSGRGKTRVGGHSEVGVAAVGRNRVRENRQSLPASW